MCIHLLWWWHISRNFYNNNYSIPRSQTHLAQKSCSCLFLHSGPGLQCGEPTSTPREKSCCQPAPQVAVLESPSGRCPSSHNSHSHFTGVAYVRISTFSFSQISWISYCFGRLLLETNKQKKKHHSIIMADNRASLHAFISFIFHLYRTVSWGFSENILSEPVPVSLEEQLC